MENQQLPPPLPPAQPLSPQDERTWAMLAHLLALTGLMIPFGSIIAPLVVWQVYKDRSAYVTYHAKESLNFHITIALAVVACIILMIILVGLFLIWVVGVAALVLTVVAGIKANNGEYYRYPLTIRFIS
ncbi:DUF4870 domain-containing protein [Arsenicibacter rosenii]|uniref:Orotate phosphoribosyltransferase n=1 Tax=Arsenicibacter rosenii TaxID=1750698 RepID=A0A1S2VDZ5_9BACT|nr:DUF4870 domain-containing protein [Arsenicibacter rosenii]OIN56981.1 orotate phosphoribosyltransferase [Arsenicibacter rosenii]